MIPLFQVHGLLADVATDSSEALEAPLDTRETMPFSEITLKDDSVATLLSKD